MGPGSYHVYAKAEDAFHIYITCSSARNVPFEVDFTGVFFYFTVSTFCWHAQHAMPLTHEDLSGLAICCKEIRIPAAHY